MRLTFIGLALGLGGISSHAEQNLPPYDAGALMRQAEQMTRQSHMQQNAAQRQPLPPAAELTESTLVQVERFRFVGHKILSAEQLQRVAASFANRPLKQHELQQLTDAISEAYRQTGWWVQVYIPRQDLSKKELILQVIETIPPSSPVR